MKDDLLITPQENAIRRIVFVGGVHGVGKTSMCSTVAARHSATHITASALIKNFRSNAKNVGNKRVDDVEGNQELLIRAFSEVALKEGRVTLLDGHYTLLDVQGGISLLGASVFRALGVSDFICVQDDPARIAARIRSRDGSAPSTQEIDLHQRVEFSHGEMISREMGKPLQAIRSFDVDSFSKFLDTLPRS